MKTNPRFLFFAVVVVLTAGMAAAALAASKSVHGAVDVTDLDVARDVGLQMKGKGAEGSAAKALLGLSQREGMFYQAALIAACAGNGPELAGEAMKINAKRLAAAILAADGVTRSLFSEKEERSAYLNEEALREMEGKSGDGEEGARAKGKAARQGVRKRHTAAAGGELLDALLQERDAETVRLALMAAAYGEHSSLKARIEGLNLNTPSYAGALLLFRARGGEAIPGEAVTNLFAAALKDKTANQRVSGAMSRFTLDVPAGVMACEAIGALPGRGVAALLHAALNSPDIRVQAEAARAIARTGDADSVPVLLQKLAGCPWPVLVEVANALGAIPDARSIPPLIARLKQENGRFRLDVVHALSSIAGAQKGRTASEWDAWWKKEGAAFAVDAKATSAYREKTRVQDVEIPTLGYFYSLPIFSERICFVVDSSMSMKGDRIASLRTNLKETLKGMNAKVAYNIVNFGGIIEILRAGGMTTDRETGVSRTDDIDLSSGTRSFDAMEVGMRLDEVDTIYFLSDGKPTRSQIDPWDDIRRALTALNRHRQIAIFAVEFNVSGHTLPMVRMTDENFGRYEAVDVAGAVENEEMNQGGERPRDADRKKPGLPVHGKRK